MLQDLTWFRQAAFRWEGQGPVVYIDPWGITDPVPADVILITHAHHDHFQPREIDRLRTPTTKLVAPKDVAAGLSGDVTPVAPGEVHEVGGLRFETVPAYNIAEERLDMHPQRNGWVGYLFEYAGRRFYHGGDTDALPELEPIRTDVALVPIGGTYTMDAEEAADFVRAMEPGLAVPMHYGYVVCSPSRADVFRKLAAPVPVQILDPTNPFEQP
ncbi:MAG TPA: MBL fold metallo-hydrolase [Actinomycetota bacterium]|nr:MBL fold metallo-hydrolase [Actinomycetota bacterium]